jgi:hypothetical protein
MTSKRNFLMSTVCYCGSKLSPRITLAILLVSNASRKPIRVERKNDGWSHRLASADQRYLLPTWDLVIGLPIDRAGSPPCRGYARSSVATHTTPRPPDEAPSRRF